jgi:hypothetical protein
LACLSLHVSLHLWLSLSSSLLFEWPLILITSVSMTSDFPWVTIENLFLDSQWRVPIKQPLPRLCFNQTPLTPFTSFSHVSLILRNLHSFL